MQRILIIFLVSLIVSFGAIAIIYPSQIKDMFSIAQQKPNDSSNENQGGDQKPSDSEGLKVESIALDTTDVKLVFDFGEKFTADGLKIIATMSDGSTKEIALKDCQIIKPNMSKAGTAKAFVVYEGIDVSYDITVKNPPDITIPATGSVKLEMESLDLSNSTVVTKDAFINAGIAPGNVQRQYGRIFGYVPDSTTFRAYIAVDAACEIKISFLTWGAASALSAHTFKFGDTVIDCETTSIPTAETTAESVIGTVEVAEAGTYLFEFGAGSDFDYVLFEVVEQITPDVTIPASGSVQLEMESLDLSNSTIVTKDSFINAGIAAGNVQRQYGRIFGYVPESTTFRAYVAVGAACDIKISFCTWGGTTPLNTHTYKFGDTVIDCETTTTPQGEGKVSVIGTVEVAEAGTYLFEFGGCNDFDYVLFEVVEQITPDITIPASGSVQLEMESLDLSNSTIVTKDSFINAGIAAGNVQRQYGRIFGYVPDSTTFRAYVLVSAPCNIKISFCTWGGTTPLNTHTYKFGDTVIDCETTTTPQGEGTVSVIGTVEVAEAGVYLFEFGGCNDFDYVLFEIVE